MSPEIENILQITAVSWLGTVMLSFLWGLRRLYKNGQDYVDHPRREVLRWLTDIASQFGTGAALFGLLVYFFGESLYRDGLPRTIVAFSLMILFVASLPWLGRKSREAPQTDTQ